MAIPSTAVRFRAAVCTLDGKEGGFHTVMVPKDRCVRLLQKEVRKRMPVNVVREMEYLNTRVEGFTQL
jgi:hypothetical protein